MRLIFIKKLPSGGFLMGYRTILSLRLLCHSPNVLRYIKPHRILQLVDFFYVSWSLWTIYDSFERAD